MRINFKRSVGLAAAALAIGLVGCAPKAPETPASNPANTAVTPPAPIVAKTEAAPTAVPADTKAAIAAIGAKVRELSSYTMTMAMTQQGQTQELKISTKLEGAKPAKMKMTMAGNEVLIDIAGKATYIINPTTKTALKTTLSDADLAKMPDALDEAIKEADQADAKFSEDTLDGKKVWKIETAQMPKTTTWFDPATGLPLKAETPESSGSFTYTDLNAVPDATFEVPAGYAVTSVDTKTK